MGLGSGIRKEPIQDPGSGTLLVTSISGGPRKQSAAFQKQKAALQEIDSC
jgi:hypothetical protein